MDFFPHSHVKELVVSVMSTGSLLVTISGASFLPLMVEMSRFGGLKSDVWTLVEFVGQFSSNTEEICIFKISTALYCIGPLLEISS